MTFTQSKTGNQEGVQYATGARGGVLVPGGGQLGWGQAVGSQVGILEANFTR